VNTNNDEECCEWVELYGYIDCHSTFEEFLYVAKSVPTTNNQLTHLNCPGPSSTHMVGKEEEKMEKTWPSTLPTPHKDALMLLSVPDSVLSASDTDDKIVKAMDKPKNSVPKVYKNGLKQSTIDSYYKNQ
jgi:hypothetical protein